MKKNLKRILLISASFAALIAYLVYKEGLDSIKNIFNIINPVWIAAALLSMIGGYLCTATILSILLRPYTKKRTFFRNLRNDMVANMLGVVTPLSSGNMAYQIAKMSKDYGIDAGDSSAIMVKKNLFGQGGIIIVTTFMLLTRSSYFEINAVIKIAIILSFVGNSIVLLLYLLAPEKEELLSSIACAVLNFLGKIHVLKQIEERKQKAKSSIHKLKINTEAIKLSWIETVALLLTSVLQNMFVFQTCFFIYKALGLAGQDYLTVVSAQTLCTLVQNSVPIPGGLGVADYAFNNILKPVMGQFIDFAMVLWRMVTFYWPIIIGLFMSLKFKQKKKD